MAAEPSPENLQ